jgi:hypothetical protein
MTRNSLTKHDRDRLLAMSDAELLRHCRMDVMRGSGPGGQKRNRTESAVRLTVQGSGVQVVCDKTRSQAKNRELALREIRLRLALECRFPTQETERGWTEPPPLKHPEFPVWVARVLDVFASHGWQAGETARALKTSTNHFSRGVLSDDRVLRAVNRERERLGLRALKSSHK